MRIKSATTHCLQQLHISTSIHIHTSYAFIHIYIYTYIHILPPLPLGRVLQEPQNTARNSFYNIHPCMKQRGLDFLVAVEVDIHKRPIF